MWALFLLAKFLVYLIVLIFIFWVLKKYCGWRVALTVTCMLSTAPSWDYYKVIKHDELCELDGGYRVYKTVPEGVESYFHSFPAIRAASFSWELENYKYAFIEGFSYKDKSKFFRYSLNDMGEVEEIEIPRTVSEYEWFTEYLTSLPYDLTGSRSGIRNRQTGEVLASITNYVLKEPWGWYFSLLGGKGCHSMRTTRASLFFTEVIPSKKLKEQENGKPRVL